MLVELGLVEQRYRAVLEVLKSGSTVSDVARRYGVGRQTVHRGCGAMARGVWADWPIGASTPIPVHTKCRRRLRLEILELRRLHPGWGPRTILNRLTRDGIEPVPSRSAIYRALVRHKLIYPTPRRSRPQRLQALGAVTADGAVADGRHLGVCLADGSRASIVTGIDDYSRFCVCASVVVRATAKPVCDAFLAAMTTHGVPEEIFTDNGKVFTNRFGPGKSFVLFDRICQQNSIKHRLTAARSPTTTGKVERFHKTLKREFLDGKVFASGRGPRGNRHLGGALQHRTRPSERRESATGRTLRLGAAPPLRDAHRVRGQRRWATQAPTHPASALERLDHLAELQVPRRPISGRPERRRHLQRRSHRGLLMTTSWSPRTPDATERARRRRASPGLGRAALAATSRRRRDSKGRRQRRHPLRRHGLSGRQCLSPTSGRSGHQGRHRPDLGRWTRCCAPTPSDTTAERNTVLSPIRVVDQIASMLPKAANHLSHQEPEPICPACTGSPQMSQGEGARQQRGVGTAVRPPGDAALLQAWGCWLLKRTEGR